MLRTILRNSTLLLAAALMLGACARAQTTAGNGVPPTAEPVVSATPHGAWTFTLDAGGQSMPGSMTIGREGARSRITVRDLNLIDEVVHGESLELGSDGRFVWSGAVGGSSFTMSGRVVGDDLTAEAQAADLGRMTIRGRRAHAGQ